MWHRSKRQYVKCDTHHNIYSSSVPHFTICTKPICDTLQHDKQVFAILHKLYYFVCLKYWFMFHVFATKNPYKRDIWSIWLRSECETATTNAWTSNLATSKIPLGEIKFFAYLQDIISVLFWPTLSNYKQKKTQFQVRLHSWWDQTGKISNFPVFNPQTYYQIQDHV